MAVCNILSVRANLLKVILNVDAITHPITGIGQYTLQIGRQLAQQQQVQHLRLFSANRWIEDIEVTAAENQWLSRLRHWIPFKSLALNTYAKRRAKHFANLTAQLTDHVFHSPNFILMPFAGRSVATFHDLSFIHYRETQPAYRLQFLDREIPNTLAQADALITPSIHVKQEIVEHFGYPANNIHVTPLGVADNFRPLTAEQCVDCLSHHRLTYKQFILSVATTEPRKNLKRLLQAFMQLPEALRKARPLVLAGSKGWLNQELNQQIKALLKQQQIITLGYVNQQQLQQLYAAASLTALPSLYEGFGLPIIESMAAGTPVLTSHNSAMQEVAGGHAMLCDPLDTKHMASRLQQALEDSAWLQQAAQAGVKHSQKFRWSNTAESTLKVYQSLA